MILLLVLGATLGAQAAPADAPLGRFVICPGNRRCPPRPSRQSLGGGGAPINVDYGRTRLPGVSFVAPPMYGGGSPGNSLLFDPGDSALNVEARELLDEIAERTLRDPSIEVLLEGHADSRGSEAANVALAGQRAAAAEAYLAGRGVPADRILMISWGEAGQSAVTEPRSVVVTVRARPGARAR